MYLLSRQRIPTDEQQSSGLVRVISDFHSISIPVEEKGFMWGSCGSGDGRLAFDDMGKDVEIGGHGVGEGGTRFELDVKVPNGSSVEDG